MLLLKFMTLISELQRKYLLTEMLHENIRYNSEFPTLWSCSSVIKAVWHQDGGFKINEHGIITDEWSWRVGHTKRKNIAMQVLSKCWNLIKNCHGCCYFGVLDYLLFLVQNRSRCRGSKTRTCFVPNPSLKAIFQFTFNLVLFWLFNLYSVFSK